MYEIVITKITPNPTYKEEMGVYESGRAEGRYPDKPLANTESQVFMANIEDDEWPKVKIALLDSLNQ